MKQFFKFMFASFAGTLLTIVIVMLFFVIMIAGMVAMTENKEVSIKPNTEPNKSVNTINRKAIFANMLIFMCFLHYDNRFFINICGIV